METNLPDITPDQARALAACLSGYGGLVEIAAAAGMDLGEFLNHLAAPNVQTHLRHAKRIARQRAEQQLAEAAQPAIHCLKMIIEDVDHDKTERRRAASAVLRAFTGQRTKRRTLHRGADLARVIHTADQLVREDPNAVPQSPPEHKALATIDNNLPDNPQPASNPRTRHTNESRPLKATDHRTQDALQPARPPPNEQQSPCTPIHGLSRP